MTKTFLSDQYFKSFLFNRQKRGPKTRKRAVGAHLTPKIIFFCFSVNQHEKRKSLICNMIGLFPLLQILIFGAKKDLWPFSPKREKMLFFLFLRFHRIVLGLLFSYQLVNFFLRINAKNAFLPFFRKKFKRSPLFWPCYRIFFLSLRVPGCHPFSTLLDQTISLMISAAQKIKKIKCSIMSKKSENFENRAQSLGQIFENFFTDKFFS